MRRPFVLLLLAALPGLAHADDALHQRVIAQLSGIDTAASEADLRALGDDVGAELFVIARDTSALRSYRASAVQALGWFPDGERHTWLTTLLADARGDRYLRRSACHALAMGWGDTALPDLERALSDQDVQLRNQAVRAIGVIGTPAARASLTARLAVEPNVMVRDAIGSTLGGAQ